MVHIIRCQSNDQSLAVGVDFLLGEANRERMLHLQLIRFTGNIDRSTNIHVLIHFALRSRSRSKVGVKVMGRGQRSRSSFWHATVDIWGSALTSAVKSNKSHFQSNVVVCVSVISGA